MKRFIITGLVICGMVIGVWSLIRFFPKAEADPGPPVVPVEKTGGIAAESGSKPAVVAEPGLPETAGADDAEFDAEMNQEIIVARLNELFADRIDHVRIQLQAIEKLIRYLKEMYPDDWQDHVFACLSAAFPEQAAELYDNYLKLMGFKEWIAGNYQMLLNMDAKGRKTLLWAKRQQFFGDEADLIWEMEIRAEQTTLSLEEINRQPKMPFCQKVDYYLAELNDIYDNQAEAYRQSYQQKVLDQFLTVESVQADLRQMTPEARRENLALLRKAIGLDDAAMSRWAELDSRREERWGKGQAYMRAREQVIAESGSLSRESMLDDLRQACFGAEAKTIKQEEQAGLFRFSQKRVYGKN